VFTRAEHPFLQQLFLHQFLDLFAVGWFGLALLGLLWSHVDATGSTPQGWRPTFSLALLLAPTFLLGMSPAVLPASLFWVAAVANAGAALLLGVHGVQLWRHRRKFPQLLWLAGAGLASVIAVAAFLLWPGVWQQSAGGQLRIFYLHVFLLMWVSTALLGLLEARLLSASALVRWLNALWVGGVLVMVGGLLGLGVAPMLGWPQLLWLNVSAWGSLAVALSATLLLVALLLRGSAIVPR
ncbi:MAG: hypothetical protein WAU00_24070, partial [Caldilinea sp.]